MRDFIDGFWNSGFDSFALEFLTSYLGFWNLVDFCMGFGSLTLEFGFF